MTSLLNEIEVTTREGFTVVVRVRKDALDNNRITVNSRLTVPDDWLDNGYTKPLNEPADWPYRFTYPSGKYNFYDLAPSEVKQAINLIKGDK